MRTTWLARTTAQKMVEGAVIHLDKGEPPTAPVNGEHFIIYNDSMPEVFKTTIVSLEPGKIVFEHKGQKWKAVPAPEAEGAFQDDRGGPMIPLRLEVASD